MDEFNEMKRVCNKRREDNKMKLKEGSKQRLMAIIRKNFTTTMIGSLSEFEKSFGYLWGHGEHYNELTEQQQEFREMWEYVRSNILDLGHQKMNGSLDELSRHTITWDLYQSTVIFNKDNKGNEGDYYE